MKTEYEAPTFETNEVPDMVVSFMCSCSAEDDNVWTSPWINVM